MAAVLLLVSVNDEVVYVLRRYAEAGGHQLVASERGEAAIAVMRNIQPDVIILDINSGSEAEDQAGWDTLRRLKADDQMQAIPVIVCSWHKPQVPVDLVMADWLQKPMLYQQFIRVINAITHQAGNHSDPADPA